jgi:light-regulated signal transduction histidine kinase (bacteriophytochrome)
MVNIYGLFAFFAGMDGLARATLEELEPSMKGRGVKAGLGTPPPARGGPAMPRQVRANLIKNAGQFAKNKHHAVSGIGGRTCDDENVYCVRDNGAGFDMRFSGKLFGIFQRLHGAGEFEGTGTGLASVKRILSRRRGRVWAEGKRNEGATFYFALPATNEEDGHA